MGKPVRRHGRTFRAQSISSEGEPGELKHLSTPRKRKRTAIPPVAASEKGTAQTVSVPSPRALRSRGSGCPLGPVVEGPGRDKPALLAEVAWKGAWQKVKAL